LQGFTRIDSEFYQPHYLDLIASLEKAQAKPLSEIADVVKRKFEPVSGKTFKYIEISEVDTQSGLINAVETNGEEAPSRAQYVVQSGDVIISSVRPNRNAVALISREHHGFVCSSGFVVLRPKSVSSEFLFASLKAEYVRILLDRQTTATMYPAVSEVDLIEVPLIVPAKSVISRMEEKVRKAKQLEADSEKLYLDAENLLASELGLDKLDLSESLFNVRNVSDVINAARADAEYFQEKYYRLENFIANNKFPYKTLGELIEPVKNGFDYREFTDEGTPYIRVGDVRNGRIDTENSVKIPFEYDEIDKDVKLKIGDVLFTRKGTFGQAAVVRDRQEKSIISSEIMLLRMKKEFSKDILPDYLALYFNSNFGYQQVIRRVHGVAYYSISQPDLAQILILIPKIPVQEKITEKILSSLDAEKEAKRLLAEAKSAVEGMIEG